MSRFQVVSRNGKFSIENDREVLGEVHDQGHAETICEQLNRWPSERACEAVPNGRWTRKDNCDA